MSKQYEAFIRQKRLEGMMSAYIQSRQYVRDQGRDAGLALIEQRIDELRQKLSTIQKQRNAEKNPDNEHLAPNGNPIDGYPLQQA